MKDTRTIGEWLLVGLCVVELLQDCVLGIFHVDDNPQASKEHSEWETDRRVFMHVSNNQSESDSDSEAINESADKSHYELHILY